MSNDASHLNYEFERIATALCSIENRFAALQEQALPNTLHSTTPLQRAKEYYRKRRLRDRMFADPNLFADPAWDILIDLYIASEEGRGISVSSACIASAVPVTTALRWIKILEQGGHISRHEDPSDARRVFMSLTESAAKTVREFFSD
jgi:DNA-binding MarR family transcriptional regulator